jgi:thiamine-phosphate pyrophosphorylase
MPARIPFRLLAVADCAPTPADLAARARVLIDAGVRAIQIRCPAFTEAQLLDATRAAADDRAMILVNRFACVARDARAGGLHLPEASETVEAARRQFDRGIIGASVHSVERALERAAEGVDYLIAGPIFSTPSKLRFGDPLGAALLARIVSEVAPIPVLAIGGVVPDNTLACLEAGARGVAVIRALWDAVDPSAVIESFRRIMGEI